MSNSRRAFLASVAIAGIMLPLGSARGQSSTPGRPDPAPAGDSQPATNNNQADQVIIVTAQKREERQQDVPIPMTAIAGATLSTNNTPRLQDYYTQIPGLSVAPGTLGGPRVTIRGLSSIGGNPTAGIVVDDIPYGSTTALGGGGQVPSFDPGELARIEVLRGPQGTLYGASSLGGLIKFVTVDPSTAGFRARAELGLSGVAHSGDLGYNARAMANVPISSTIAVLASGFIRRDPGFIDNVQTGERDVNRTDVDGGRISAIWRPSSDVSLTLAALYQDSRERGAPFVNLLPGLGELQQSVLRDTGGFRNKIQFYTGRLRVNAGGAEIVSLTGYSVNRVFATTDYTFAFGSRANFFFNVPSARYQQENRTTRFSQELRISVPITSNIDWLIGGFYTSEDSRYRESLFAVNPTTGQVPGLIFSPSADTTYREYAAFTDLTVRFSDRFDIQLGGRLSKNRQTYLGTFTGPFVPAILGQPQPFRPPAQTTNDSSFTYLVTPRFKLTPQIMLYGRLASGYRPGGSTANTSVNNLPPFEPDTTRNYEVGIKGYLVDRVVYVDASVYYIDWNKIQLNFRNPVTGITAIGNAGGARSQGVELALSLRPWRGMSIDAWGAWNDAELTEDLPTGGAVGHSGDRLPTSSEWSGRLAIQQSFPIGGDATAFVGASATYTSDSLGNFTGGAGIRQHFNGYTQFDLRAGFDLGRWSANFYVNNLTDKYAFIPSINSNQTGYYPIRPRTIGASVSARF